MVAVILTKQRENSSSVFQSGAMVNEILEQWKLDFGLRNQRDCTVQFYRGSRKHKCTDQHACLFTAHLGIGKSNISQDTCHLYGLRRKHFVIIKNIFIRSVH